MHQITTPSGKIALTFTPQEGKLGRSFRLSSIRKGKDSKWVGRELKHDWIYIFKYLDDSSFFGIHIGVNGRYIDKLDDEACCSF